MKIDDVKGIFVNIGKEFSELAVDIKERIGDQTILAPEETEQFVGVIERARISGIISSEMAAKLHYHLAHWGELSVAQRLQHYMNLTGLVRREGLVKQGLPLERQHQVATGVKDTTTGAMEYAERFVRRMMMSAGRKLQHMAAPEAVTPQEEDPLPMDEVTQRLHTSTHVLHVAWSEFLKARRDLAQERRAKHPDSL